MSLIIPDIVLVNSLNTALRAVREDYKVRKQANQLNRSFLYLLFNRINIGTNYVVLDNIVDLIITTPETPKHIVVKSSFDHNTNDAPFVYVTLPSESDRYNTLGIGAGNVEELVFNNTPEGTDEYKNQFTRSWESTYLVVIGSENRNEALILYHFFKALMIVLINHLSLEGLANIKLGGQDLRMNNAVPDKLYMKSITVNFEYEQTIPELTFTEIVRKIRLYWKPEGAEQRQGPIVFGNDDDVDDSDSV